MNRASLSPKGRFPFRQTTLPLVQCSVRGNLWPDGPTSVFIIQPKQRRHYPVSKISRERKILFVWMTKYFVISHCAFQQNFKYFVWSPNFFRLSRYKRTYSQLRDVQRRVARRVRAFHITSFTQQYRRLITSHSLWCWTYGENNTSSVSPFMELIMF